MRDSIAMAVILFCAMGSHRTESETSPNADANEVRQVIAGLEQSWNLHDMHAFASLFREDASFVNVNGSWLKNRAEIEESHKLVHASIFKNSTAEVTPAKINFPKPEIAIVQAKWRLRGDSRNANPRDYIMTLILRKEGEGWKIVAAQNGSAEDRSTQGFANLRPGDVAPIPVSPPPGSPPGREDRVRAVFTAFDRACGRRDSTAIAGLIMPGADWVDIRARWIQGNRQIAGHIANVEWQELGSPELTSGIERLAFIDSDLAYAQLRWMMKAAGGAATPIQGMGLRVVQRDGKSWRILAAEDTVIRALGR